MTNLPLELWQKVFFHAAKGEIQAHWRWGVLMENLILSCLSVLKLLLSFHATCADPISSCSLSLTNKFWNYWAFECLYILPNLEEAKKSALIYLTCFPQRSKQVRFPTFSLSHPSLANYFPKMYSNLKKITFSYNGYGVDFGDEELRLICGRFKALEHLDTVREAYWYASAHFF